MAPAYRIRVGRDKRSRFGRACGALDLTGTDEGPYAPWVVDPQAVAAPGMSKRGVVDPAELLRVTPDDERYRRMAAAEASYWEAPHPLGIESPWEHTPEQVTDRYVNERYTGSPDVRWEDTVHRHGPFRRGLALGTSGIEQEARLLTSNAELHLTFVDLSPGALARRQQLLEPRFPGRVATMVANLNFLELGEESYDLIISVSSAHHVVNLEHLAWQINRGLTPSGTFFLHDYVGECCFQFAPEKKRLFEVLSYREALRAGRQPGVVWFGDGDLSPEDTCDRSHRPGQAPPAPVPRHGGRCGRVATPLVV
jgi:SAM-dependent methyltransferase